MPSSTPFSMLSVNYPSKTGSDSIFMNLVPIHQPPLHLQVVSLSLILPKSTWILALNYFSTISLSAFLIYPLLLDTYHLLPEILQLHAKQYACYQVFLLSVYTPCYCQPSVYYPCYCQRQLSEIQTTPLI